MAIATTYRAKRKWIEICIFAFLLQLFSHSVFPQALDINQSSCIEAEILIQNAKELFLRGEYERTIIELLEVINLGVQDSCPRLLIEAYSIQAQSFEKQLDIENTLIGYLNAISIAEKYGYNTTSIELYRTVGDIFFQRKVFPKAADYYSQALELIDDNDTEQRLFYLENFSLSSLGYYNYEEAAKALQHILEISEPKPFLPIRSRAYFQLSEIYRKQKMWTKAIEYCNLLTQYMQEVKDTLGLVIALNNLSYNQISNKEFSNAETAINRALDLSKKISLPTTLVAGLYTNLGICYQNQGNYPRALNNLNNAKAFVDPVLSPNEMANIYNTMAWVYYRRSDLYNASQHSRQSIEWALKSDDAVILAECYRTYSILLREGNDHIGAFDYFEKYSSIRDSIDIANRVSEQSKEELLARLEKTEKEQRLYIADKEMQSLMLKQLRLEAERQRQELELLKKERDLEQLERHRAYQNLQLVKREQEAALQQSTIRNLEQENAIKELQIKQKEAEELQREKEIALLQSEKEKQQLQIEKETETRKRAIWMLVLSFLILVVVIAGLITTRKKNTLLAHQKNVIEEKNENLEQANKDIIDKNVQLSELAEEIRTQNEEITTQKELIEEKNKNITDSIQYASLIQTAVLPTPDILSESFNDYFILFKPRDIVSGDFWWYHKNSQRVILAVADCTGHGVPGAILSMLGTALLNEIASQNHNIKANLLLNQLKTKIIEALVHNDKSNPRRDGMDIAVCIFNPNSNEVEIAGANNPVYVLRNGSIEIIKGDKAPIGVHQGKTDSFSLKTFERKAGDRFYLFSDGFPDQFGGEKGRKLMYKHFRELLIESGNLPMKDQCEFLNYSFTKWQGYNDQVDDVLVIGVTL